MNLDNIWLAFGLTLLAGLSTGIGSGLAFFARRTNTKILTLSLGFSAGVMIYVSFVEILVKANDSFSAQLGARGAGWATAGVAGDRHHPLHSFLSLGADHPPPPVYPATVKPQSDQI